MSYKSMLLKNIYTEPLKSSVKSNDNVTSSSDDEVTFHNNNCKIKNKYKLIKREALLKAQEKLIKSCLPNEKYCKKILKDMNDENWNGFNVKIDISDNIIKIKHKNQTFEFTKNRFFSSPNLKHFKWHLINAYTQKFGNNIWVHLNNYDDMKYSIKISKRYFNKS